MPRHSLRKSGRISATYSSDVKPAPASSTAIERSAGDPRLQALLDALDVLDGVLLGELDHEPLGEPVGELGEPGVTERVRADVDEQQAPLGRLAGGGHRRPAGDLEVVTQAGAGGGGKRDVGRQRDEAGRRGEAREPLVADRLEVAQTDDRLEDRPDRARGQQLLEIARTICPRARKWV